MPVPLIILCFALISFVAWEFIKDYRMASNEIKQEKKLQEQQRKQRPELSDLRYEIYGDERLLIDGDKIINL